MATNLNINGVNYPFPDNGDVDWGTTVSQWAAAVTNGMLQKAGGNFTLLSDINFGPTYGLISNYYKTNSPDVADAGQIRLSNTDSINFRNGANDGNLVLSVSSDRLQYNSLDIVSVSSSDTLTNKAINAPDNTITNLSDANLASDAAIAYNKLALSDSIVNSDINSSAAIDGTKVVPDFGAQNIETSGDLRLQGTSNHVGLKAPSTAAGQVWELPDSDGSSGSVLSTDGAGALGWQSLPAAVVTGVVLDFAGVSAPTGFLLCDGSAVSRIDYANLFAVISTIYGDGDGSTTFNLPDLRGRVSVGRDDMGGSAANRVTTGVSGLDGETLGASGGNQSMQGHTHTVTGTAASAGDHRHMTVVSAVGTDNINSTNAITSGTASINLRALNSSTEPTISRTSLTGAHTHSVSGTANSTGAGSSQNVQPSIILNKIIAI